MTIATSVELLAALKLCVGGEVLRLSPGNYGALKLKGLPVYASQVQIVPLYRDGIVTFTSLSGDGRYGCGNISFSGIKFDYTFKPGDPDFIFTVSLSYCTGMTFTGCIFDGDYASGVLAPTDWRNGAGCGIAARFTSCVNSAVKHCTILKFQDGLQFLGGNGCVAENNEFFDISSDGIDIAQVYDVKILRNNFHDFRRNAGSTVHPDMIQLTSTNANFASRDIEISDNTFSIGSGSETQTIFMRNEKVDIGGGGLPMFYKNILIARNTIVNCHHHGITAGETDGLIIDGNTLSQGASCTPVPSVTIPKINVAPTSRNVMVKDNWVPWFGTGLSCDYQGNLCQAFPADWTVTGNVKTLP